MSILAQTEASPGAADRTAAAPIVVASVFFVSGMPALVYQLIWQRSLFTIYGDNIEAVTVVVAGFLLGLGIGSLAGGRVSRRASLDLLAVFGAIELITGGFGIMSLRIFDFVGKATLRLAAGELTAVTLALLLVPTVLMGSTLPILTAYLVRRSGNVGKSVGLLYCVNTVGSAFACFASALFLLRIAGMQGAVTVAASINFMVGIISLAQAWRTRGGAAPPRRQETAQSTPASAASRWVAPEMIFATVLSALVGYLFLSYEIIWFRAFSIATNTSPAFALILGAYLAGIANGSLRVRRIFNDSWARSRRSCAASAAILAAGLLGFVLLPAAAYAATTGVGYFFPMLLMIFMQTSVGGIVFPILCDYAIPADDATGSGVGGLYVANILGSVAGTLVTGFVLMNLLSIAEISAFLGVFGVGLALLVALQGQVCETGRRVVIGLGIAALLGIPASSGIMFRNFYDRLLTNNVISGGGRFVDVVENRNGVITVDEQSRVYGSGAYDGRVAIDLMDDENLLLRPFSLNLFHPRPERVLMIGLATGAWAQVIANNPAVKHLTVIEINPGYLRLIAKYPVVASLLRDPKVEIVIDDGRRWLNRHPERKYDAIVQNTTWYYRPNTTLLLSMEYLALAAAHLRDGGVIMYNTTGSLRAQRTACTAFPFGFRLFNVMVASAAPIAPDPDRLRTTLAGYRINGRPLLDTTEPRGRRRLDQIVAMLTPPPSGAARPLDAIEDCVGVRARTEGMPIVTDDNMGEEWSALPTTDPLLRRLVRAGR